MASSVCRALERGEPSSGESESDDDDGDDDGGAEKEVDGDDVAQAVVERGAGGGDAADDDVVEGLGTAVQVELIKPVLKAPGTTRFKPQYDKLLLNVACKSNLRRSIPASPSPPLPPHPPPSTAHRQGGAG